MAIPSSYDDVSSIAACVPLVNHLPPRYAILAEYVMNGAGFLPRKEDAAVLHELRCFLKKFDAARVPPKKRKSGERYIDKNARIIVLGLCPTTLEIVKDLEKGGVVRRRLSILSAPFILAFLGFAITGIFMLLPESGLAGKNADGFVIEPHITLFLPRDYANTDGGGGGSGGAKLQSPPSRGKLPDIKKRQFVPPTTTPTVKQPELIAPPSLEGTIEAQAPPTNMPLYGDPLASPLIAPPSDGSGAGGGIGTNKGGGIGSGSGPGYGPGTGGGTGGGAGGGIGAGIGKGRSDTRAVLAKWSRPVPDQRFFKTNAKRDFSLAVRVTLEGAVQETYILVSSGDAELDAALIAHIKQWTVYAVRAKKGPDGKTVEERVAEWVILPTIRL